MPEKDFDLDYDRARKVFMRLSGGFILVCLLGLVGANLTSCALFQPQADVAALCRNVTERNAAVTCVKSGYAAIADVANLVEQRYTSGAISLPTARNIARALEDAYELISLAETAAFAGNLADVEGRMNAAIEILTALEAGLK